MAFETPLFDLAFKADADLSSLQFCIVKVTGESQCGTVSVASHTPLGILQNKPGSLQAAAVRILGVSKLVASAGITAGSLVASTAGAKGVMVATGDGANYTLGIALDTVANANEVVSVLLTHAGRAA